MVPFESGKLATTRGCSATGKPVTDAAALVDQLHSRLTDKSLSLPAAGRTSPAQGPSKARGNQAKEPEPVEKVVAPIRRVARTGEEDGIFTDTKILKGYEFEDGRFVTMEEEDLKALETRTGSQMEVLEFVPLTEVDPVYFETSYYVRPDPGGEKPSRFCSRGCSVRGWSRSRSSPCTDGST